MSMNTRISYLYRDADNYKVHNECVVRGAFTEEQVSGILACLDAGEYFKPAMVGLPEKRFDAFDPEVDHDWMELGRYSFALTDAEADIDLDMAALAENFRQCRDHWDREDAPQTEITPTIRQITAADLRRMDGQEGLILQGCGGDPKEWLEGINELLTREGILRNGSGFGTVSVFRHGEMTNMLFPFKGVELDMGRLAMWRLRTHDVFGGTWLSDYVPNRLGGFVQETPAKPICPLAGADGNIFNLLGIASRALRENGQEREAREMMDRVTGGNCHSYEEALGIICEYVEPADAEQLTRQKRKDKSAYDR